MSEYMPVVKVELYDRSFAILCSLVGLLVAAACVFGIVKVGSGLVRDVKPFIERAMKAETISEIVSHVATVRTNLERRGLADKGFTKEVGQALERLEALRDTTPANGVLLDIAHLVVRDLPANDFLGGRYWYLRIPLGLVALVSAAVSMFTLMAFFLNPAAKKPPSPPR